MMSTYDGDGFHAGGAAPAARVGADLRAARERLGWRLDDVAAYLRIRLSFLEAIEDGRTSDLPGTAYAVGFLRAYAQLLGVDSDEVARRFRAEAAEANRKTELNFPAPVPDRGIPAGAIVLVGAVLAIGAYVGWYKMSGNNRPTTELVQALPERLAPLVAHATPATPPPAPVVQRQAVALSEEPPPPPLPSIPPSSAAAAMAPGGYASVPAAATAAAPMSPTVVALAAPPPVVMPPPVEAARLDGPRIVLRARADSWIQVRDKGGQVLLNRVLRGGESWQVPVKPSLLLTTGNAAGTELVVDGVTTASLGADGAVRRDLPLDADAIKDGRLAAPQSATAGAAKKSP